MQNNVFGFLGGLGLLSYQLLGPGSILFLSVWQLIWGVPIIRGTILGVPIIRVYNILGSILGYPYFGKLPYLAPPTGPKLL